MAVNVSECLGFGAGWGLETWYVPLPNATSNNAESGVERVTRGRVDKDADLFVRGQIVRLVL